MKRCLKKNGLLILVIILSSLVFLYFACKKSGFFIDEIHTYGLSNSHFAPYITDAVGGQLDDAVITRQQLIDYATVDNGQIFDFASVYSNQEADVHPPLYYFLFNIVSSFVGENFTKWTGLILGYIAFVASLIMLYVLSMKIFDENKISSLCATALYGLSTMGISTAVFIRMYMVLSFFTILLAYLAYEVMKEKKISYCLLFGITIFLGLLTQYYFVFYAFFLCFIMDIHFARTHQFKLLFKFSLISIASVLIMVAVFPACIKHIFVGNGMVVGGSSLTDAIKHTELYGYRLNTFMHFITYGLKAAIFCGCLAIIVYRKFKLKREIIIIVLPAVLSWLVIAIISPVYEERYVYNLAPIFILLAAWFIKDDIKALPVSIAVSFVCLIIATPNNLFLHYEEYDSILEQYSELPCVYLQDNKFEGLTYDYEQLLIFDEVYATSSCEKAAEYIEDADSAVVFVDQDKEWSSGYDADALLPIIVEESGYDNYELLYSNGFSGTYLLSKGA